MSDEHSWERIQSYVPPGSQVFSLDNARGGRCNSPKMPADRCTSSYRSDVSVCVFLSCHQRWWLLFLSAERHHQKGKKGVVAVRETKKYTVWQNEMSPPTPGFQTFPCFFFFFSSDVYRLYIRITKKRNLDRQSLLLPPTMYIHQQKELLQSNKSCALVYMLDRRKIGLLLRKLKGIFSFFLSFFGGNYGCAGKRQSNTTISAALCN